MDDVSALYGRMRGSELNQRVGGGDPEEVGFFCYHNIKQQIGFAPGDRILDFGCGIGRVLVQVAKETDPSTKIVGMDIMPDAIAFCRENIAGIFPNTTFELIEGGNVHYDKYIVSGGAKSRADILGSYGRSFSKAYAFSVFTHVDLDDFATLLRFVGDLLAKDGELLLTCFILTAFSRAAIENKKTTFGFDASSFENDGQVFIGNGADRLAFIAYDLGLLDKLVSEAGLVISRIEFGAWRGSGFGSSLHDMLVLRRAE